MKQETLVIWPSNIGPKKDQIKVTVPEWMQDGCIHTGQSRVDVFLNPLRNPSQLLPKRKKGRICPACWMFGYVRERGRDSRTGRFVSKKIHKGELKGTKGSWAECQRWEFCLW